MKRSLSVLLLLSAIGAGSYYYTVAATPTEEPQILQVAVSAGDIVEVVQSTGTLGPLQTVNLGSQVSGVVSGLFADFNTIVKKGQVVATIDPSLLQVQVDLQSAAVERQLGEIANQATQLENDTRQLERTKMMHDKGLAARQLLEEDQLQVKMRTTQLEAAKKTLQTAQANLGQAKLNLSYTTIRSPIDGVVVNRLVDIGQTVQSSMNVAQFFTLATDLHTLRLQASVDESDISRIRPGMPVLFSVDSYPGESFRGAVDSVTLNAQTLNNVVTFPVWIEVPNPDLKLRPSMTANLRIIVSTARGVTRIPNAAARFRPTPDTYAALGLEAPAAPASRAGGPAGGNRGERGAAAPGGGRRGDPGAPTPRASQAVTAEQMTNATKIDELFAPMARVNSRATVWTWDESARKLSSLNVRLGATDGQYSQLLEGEVPVGHQLVTSVVLPQTSVQRNQQNNIFGGNAGRGGPGGPGGFGGGPPGGGRGF